MTEPAPSEAKSRNSVASSHPNLTRLAKELLNATEQNATLRKTIVGLKREVMSELANAGEPGVTTRRGEVSVVRKGGKRKRKRPISEFTEQVGRILKKLHVKNHAIVATQIAALQHETVEQEATESVRVSLAKPVSAPAQVAPEAAVAKEESDEEPEEDVTYEEELAVETHEPTEDAAADAAELSVEHAEQ